MRLYLFCCGLSPRPCLPPRAVHNCQNARKCHSCESRNPAIKLNFRRRIPVYTGMTIIGQSEAGAKVICAPLHLNTIFSYKTLICFQQFSNFFSTVRLSATHFLAATPMHAFTSSIKISVKTRAKSLLSPGSTSNPRLPQLNCAHLAD